MDLASHAGVKVFSGARISLRAFLKTPAWEATVDCDQNRFLRGDYLKSYINTRARSVSSYIQHPVISKNYFSRLMYYFPAFRYQMKNFFLFLPVSSCDSLFGYQVNILHVFIISNGCLLYMLVNQCMADLTIIQWKLF